MQIMSPSISSPGLCGAGNTHRAPTLALIALYYLMNTVAYLLI